MTSVRTIANLILFSFAVAVGAWSGIVLVVLGLAQFGHVMPFVVFGLIQLVAIFLARKHLRRYFAVIASIGLVWLAIQFLFVPISGADPEFDLRRTRQQFEMIKSAATEDYERTSNCEMVAHSVSRTMIGTVEGKELNGVCVLYELGFDRDDDRGQPVDMSSGFLSADAFPWSKIPLSCLAMRISGAGCAADGDIILGEIRGH